MAEKLIINAVLNRKADCYSPEKCVVDKVIKLNETEFKNLVEHPLRERYFIRKYRELMGVEGNLSHCILAVGKESGDGLLIKSEGADYARYSQFIPNASGIIAAHEQTSALSELEKCLKNWVADCVSDSGDKLDFCVHANEFLNDKHNLELLDEWVCQEIRKHPRIGFLERKNDAIVAVKGELTEIKLYCPLKIVSEPEDYSADLCEENPEKYADYAAKINAKIHSDISRDEDMNTRGLIAFTDNNHLYRKVFSAFPQVENRDGKLYGVIAVKSYEEPDKADLIDLAEELTGQLSDGWGKSFEQREIRLGDDVIYISFWNSENFFLLPESEMFPEPEMKQTIGGLS